MSKRAQPLPSDGWVQDSGMARAIDSLFGADLGYVPSNPLNFESQRGRPSWIPDGQGIAMNRIQESNPYGDGRRFRPPTEPVAVNPVSPAACIMAPPAPEPIPSWTPTDGSVLARVTNSYPSRAASAPPPPLGTNMGQVGGSNRNTPPPGPAA